MKKIAILAALAGAWSGCTVNFNQPVVPPQEQTAAQRNFDAVWAASLKVLREYYFEVASEDRREGTIVTQPLLARQALEFWRKDAVTPMELAEDTFQTIFKTVTVTIRPAGEDPDLFVASVAVEITRSDKPAMTITSSSEAYGLFTMTGDHNPWLRSFDRTPSEGEERKEEKKDASDRLRSREGGPTSRPARGGQRWEVSLGRDGPLERQMAADIARATTRVQTASK